MDGEAIKRKILSSLNGSDEPHTKKIAKQIGISPSTTSKYLKILEAEGKVVGRKQLPYTFWSPKK